MDGGNAGRADRWVSRANQPPRKIVVASSLGEFTGPVEERLAKVKEVANRAALEAGRKYAGRGVDLMVFTEFAIQRRSDGKAADQAVELRGEVLDSLGAVAREHHMWLVVPMTLRERARISNAAVLFNRAGGVAGIFRKVHPMVDDAGVFEGGVTPGNSYPVFDCDFGRLGILICWDMGYDEVWDALAAGGAEIVALPTASPQTLRPSAEALRHHYYVVTSPPRDNASLYDPIGRPVARITEPGVLVHEIDLSYAILHWNERLHEGHALTERFGNKVGYEYSTREDTGIFWSNDPRTSIGEMVREFGLREMPVVMEQVEEAARKMRGDAK
ncbi:MAG TPA: carbon-nitrogen hydrolase family protein [Opitutus sp.]|nr:carbon-nitrogen hydrolase family protein [Opitutus sp.]